MRVCISVIGTPGDVFPLLSLGAGLQQAGHFVRFATSSFFREQVERASLEFYPLSGKPESFFGGRAGIELRKMVRQPQNFQRFWNLCVGPYARTYLNETWQAARGCDTAVCVPWFNAVASLSEKLGAPCFASTAMPGVAIPSSYLPNPMASETPAKTRREYRRSWRGSTSIFAASYEQVNEWRAGELGLRPLTQLDAIRTYRRTPFLLSYSELVLPRPQDWAPNLYITGFWPQLPRPEWQPSPELAAFLERNSSPVLAGFSSQVATQPTVFTRKIVDAFLRTGKSAILLSGWGGLQQTDLPPNILLQKAIPYDWVAPKLSGFLHHGGCGSMLVALRNGLPSMAIPFGLDQHLWGDRICELGCGPAPLQPDTFDVATLSDSLVRMTEDPAMRSQVQRVSQKLQKEDGVRNAITVIENEMARRHLPAS